MTRLMQRDVRAFVECLRDLYVFRSLDDFRPSLLSALGRIVGAEITSYHEMRPAEGTSANWKTPPDAVTDALEHAWERHMTEHPVLAYVVRTGDGQAMKISDFLSRRQLHGLALYNEFYRLVGLEDSLTLALSASPSVVIGIALNRNARTFSEHDRLLLNLLRPHVLQAYRNAAAVTQMQQEASLMQQGMAGLDRTAIVLSRDGRLGMVTERARQWLAAYFGQSAVTMDRLPDALQRWLRHQQEPCSDGDVPRPRAPLVIEQDSRRLVVRLMEEAEHSVLLLEEEQTTLSPAALTTLGLSRRETEVLTWVARGRSNYAIGVLLGCTEATVKKHLERIYTKLEVGNRTEAAARALAVARMPP